MSKINTDENHPEIQTSDLLLSTPTEELDPRSLLLTHDFATLTGVTREVLSVPIKRPNRQEWFFIHPDPEWRARVATIEDKLSRDIFIISPRLQEDLLGEWTGRLLVACQTRNSSPFLWMIRLPDEAGRLDSWNESATRILEDKSGQWIRIASNREVGAYDVYTPVSPIEPPQWSDSFDALLKKAFRGRVIEKPDHPMLRALRGES